VKHKNFYISLLFKYNLDKSVILLTNLDDVIEWLRTYSSSFINARKISRKFNVNSKVAAHILKQLKIKGYIVLYRRRRGRFNIYKVNKNRLNGKSGNSRGFVTVARSK
jgi:hypothetical protein